MSANDTAATEASAALRARPLVVCGPSGVGKGTLLTRLLAEYPSVFGKKVSHTTRGPRAGELDGRDYHFVGRETFERDIAAGKFIEHAYVHTNIYGTSVESVETIAKSGRVCVLELDVQGAEAILGTTLKPHFCFILPPSFDSLSSRLVGRGSETDETLAVRLDTAKKELDFADARAEIFDFKLVNDDLDGCYQQLLKQLAQLYPQFPQLTTAPKQQ